MLIRLLPFFIAILLLAAHFLRAGNLGLMVATLLVPLLLLIKQRWSLWLAQGLTYLAAFIWLTTAVQLVQQRLAQDEAWLRLAGIMAVVILLTGWAGWLLGSAPVKQHYPA